MIQAKDIVKYYGELQVLKGINVTVADKEIVSIVGDSGAGKTTLLQILGTLDSAGKGEILYDGVAVSQLKSSALADFRNKNIGFIFQFHQLLPEFNCLENVCMPAFIAGKSKAEAEANRLKQQTITPMLLQLEWINKWNGDLPSTMLGQGSNTFYGLNK